jgi:hypothetical protein
MELNLVCEICGKVCSYKGIKVHKWRVHTDEGKNFNTHKNYSGGKIPWNKGMTGFTAWNKGIIKENATFYGKKHTKQSKEKIGKTSSERIKLAWRNGSYDNKTYCTNKIFSSKNERTICKFFKSKHPEHEWKTGGRIKYNDVGIVRDLYSDLLKICFEYDGIWHFKDIKGQLRDKQVKDKCLEEWCMANEYRLIRIDENDYIDVNQIENLIYNTNEKIIKIGSRYK